MFEYLKYIDFASYIDDNVPYTEHYSIDQVVSRLEKAAESLTKWFYDNQLQAKPDKCHLILHNSYKDKIKIRL